MAKQTITLRLTIKDPVPGVCYSLQGQEGEPIDAVTATEAPLSLDAPVILNANNASVSTTNVWAMEVHPRHMFAYELRRPNRHFRVEFDLTKPVAQ